MDLEYCDLTDECMRMLFLVEDGKALDHITSLRLQRSIITASMASLLGKSCYAFLGVRYSLHTVPKPTYLAQSSWLLILAT